MKKFTSPIIDVKKYGGKQVAIMDGKIIAVGSDLQEVLKRARKRAPRRALNEIHVFAVPESLNVIYYA